MLLVQIGQAINLKLAGVPEEALQINDAIMIKTHKNMIAWYSEKGDMLGRQFIQNACSSAIHADGSWAIGSKGYIMSGSSLTSVPYTIPSNGCSDLKVKMENKKVIVSTLEKQYECLDSCKPIDSATIKKKSFELKVTSEHHGYSFGDIKVKSHCQIKRAFQLTNGYLTVKQCGAMNYVNKKAEVVWVVEQGMTKAIGSVYFEEPSLKSMKEKLEHEDIVSALIERYTTHFKILTRQIPFEVVQQKNTEFLVILSGPEDPSLFIINPNNQLNKKIMLFEEKGTEKFIAHKIVALDHKVVLSGSIDNKPTLLIFGVKDDSLALESIKSGYHLQKIDGQLKIEKLKSNGYKSVIDAGIVKGIQYTGSKETTIWSMPIPKSFELVSTAELSPIEQVAKYVINDDIKFAPPHLKAYLWHNKSTKELIVWGIDGKNGRSYIYGLLSDAHGPFTLTTSENFVYVTYTLIKDDSIQTAGVIYEMVFLSNPPPNWSFDSIENPKVKMRQVVLEKGPFSASCITQTTKGIAFRDIIGIFYLFSLFSVQWTSDQDSKI